MSTNRDGVIEQSQGKILIGWIGSLVIARRQQVLDLEDMDPSGLLEDTERSSLGIT